MIKNMKLEEESDDNEERMVNDFYDQHNQNMKSKVRFSSNEKSIIINFFLLANLHIKQAKVMSSCGSHAARQAP